MVAETISHYRILRKLGAGGMGEVYLAEDTRLDRKVALKILPAEFAEDEDRMNRFVREAKSASALNHPNIITIHEIGESDSTHYIATEFIDGKTLSEYAKSNRLNFKSALEIAIQIASALDEAHSAGIVHRDIKPDNVMVRANGLVKILDFGVAKFAEKTPANVSSEDATAIKAQATSPGMIIGTANYMSPEQAKGQTVDARSDIFSFGVVLYEMIAGHLPFRGETAVETIGAILHKEPEPLPADVPVEITQVVKKCLEKERRERYQTIKDVLIDVGDVKQDLEFQDKLERPVVLNPDENETQILQATTADEIQQKTTNKTIAAKVKSNKLLAVALAGILAIGGFFGYKYLSPTTKQIESIAVLPFVNETGNADNEYLSDGMTESLIASLSQLPNLSVKARSSVFRYKGKETSSQTVGKELSVQAVLLGRIVQRGETLTLNLELVNAQTENVIWSEQYNRKLTDIVALQSEVARDVSEKLRQRLSGAEQQRTAKTYTQNPEAYELYLKGLYLWNKRTPDDLNQALLLFQQAIEKDPAYAKAYAGLALTYSVLAGPNSNTVMTTEQEREAGLKANYAARKALELDNTLAEAYAVLGGEKVNEWDFTGAENDFNRAIELDPNYATARQWYSQLLARFGRHDEAIAEIKKAYELDPFSPAINVNIGNRYFQAGRDDEAIAQYKKFIETEPNVGFAYYFLAYAYARKEMFEEALNVWCKRDVLLKVQTPESCEKEKIEFREAIKKEGATGFWRKRLEETLDDYEKGTVFPSAVAAGYAMINDKERAFEWLEKAFAERDPDLSWLKAERSFDNIKSDPRFQDLQRRVGLPQ